MYNLKVEVLVCVFYEHLFVGKAQRPRSTQGSSVGLSSAGGASSHASDTRSSRADASAPDDGTRIEQGASSLQLVMTLAPQPEVPYKCFGADRQIDCLKYNFFG